MNRFVLDASVALAWVLDRPVPAYAARVRQELLRGTRAAVPSLWHLEVANGLAVAERRHILPPDAVDAALGALHQLASQLLETDSELIPMTSAFTAARMHFLSAYDAVYLELARRLRLPLATLDQPLKAAAAKSGVELFRQASLMVRE